MCNCYGLAFGLEVELVTDDKSFPPRSHHFPNFSPTFLINGTGNRRVYLFYEVLMILQKM